MYICMGVCICMQEKTPTRERNSVVRIHRLVSPQLHSALRDKFGYILYINNGQFALFCVDSDSIYDPPLFP